MNQKQCKRCGKMVNVEGVHTCCSQVPAIQSAVLNIGTAASDCGSARNAWIDANWDDAVMWIDCAIAQLESARAKIKSHIANAQNETREDRVGRNA